MLKCLFIISLLENIGNTSYNCIIKELFAFNLRHPESTKSYIRVSYIPRKVFRTNFKDPPKSTLYGCWFY